MIYYTSSRIGGLTVLGSKKKFDRHGNSQDTVPLYLQFSPMWEDRDEKTNALILGPELIDTDNLSSGNKLSLERCEWGQELGFDKAKEKLEEWLAANARALNLVTERPKRAIRVTLTEEEMAQIAEQRSKKGLPVMDAPEPVTKLKQGTRAGN